MLSRPVLRSRAARDHHDVRIAKERTSLVPQFNSGFSARGSEWSALPVALALKHRLSFLDEVIDILKRTINRSESHERNLIHQSQRVEHFFTNVP